MLIERESMKSLRMFTTIVCLLLISTMLLACGAEKTEPGAGSGSGRLYEKRAVSTARFRYSL